MKTQNKPTSVYYLYGLTGTEVLTGKQAINIEGIEGTRVEFMKLHDLAVVFGRLPAKEYSEDLIEMRIKDVNWLERRISEHYQAQAAVISYRSAIIPFKFCTIFKTKQKIKDFVSGKEAVFRELLSRLRGRQEWSVKVFRNKELLKRDLARTDPGVSSRINDIKNSPDGRSFLLKKKLLQDIESAAARLSISQTHKLIEDLKNISVEFRQNETFAVPEKKDEEMVANFAFLLSIEDAGIFRAKVDHFNLLHSGGGLFARCSGPWLPYNFVKVSGVG